MLGNYSFWEGLSSAPIYHDSVSLSLCLSLFLSLSVSVSLCLYTHTRKTWEEYVFMWIFQASFISYPSPDPFLCSTLPSSAPVKVSPLCIPFSSFYDQYLPSLMACFLHNNGHFLVSWLPYSKLSNQMSRFKAESINEGDHVKSLFFSFFFFLRCGLSLTVEFTKCLRWSSSP